MGTPTNILITDIDQLDLSRKYTYADYLTWRFRERVELIKGWVMKMSPAPNRKHQEISISLATMLFNFLKQDKYHVYSAPFDVRLTLPPYKQKRGKIDTVVQPDIVVVCDESKLDEQGCNGAPDLVIEILSPGNTRKEMKDKMEIYEAAAIPEYWIVDPEHECATVYTPNDQGRYVSSLPFVETDIINSSAIKGFELEVGSLFQKK